MELWAPYLRARSRFNLNHSYINGLLGLRSITPIYGLSGPSAWFGVAPEAKVPLSTHFCN